ncbi:hypothetical protein N0B51_11775 [Tsuneonella sp. YG55]|uniref:Transferrin-binding protein B C-lobe/N-lobe beta barrel domain-containing protein n=1 Tax=Tsuneonella litorea TaxID=2976475 RepID=A0A9X2W286_9SPHN|nr:hypothetical protein [Tsuneonella litorea]MCT2559658.1 hypothetical protein [Tsuneonella litorea]
MALRPRWTAAAALVLASVPAGCGGEGSGSPPVAAGIPPTPSPAPAPTATPTPASTDDPLFAGASIGETIVGPLVCSDGRVTTGAQGEVVGIGPITQIRNTDTIRITYVGPDSYRTAIDGLASLAFTPDTKRVPPSPIYARYSAPSAGELLLGQYSLGFVTFGTFTAPDLCFFAGGLPPGVLNRQTVDYFGIVDGLGVVGGVQSRFFNATYGEARMIFDFPTATGLFSFDLVQRSDPFGDFRASPPVKLGTVSANVVLAPGQESFFVPLSGAGFTGTARGRFVHDGGSILGPNIGGAGVALVYELRSPAGDLIYGSVAFAANLI